MAHSSIRVHVIIGILSVAATLASAQPVRKHPPVCADGVAIYNDAKAVPTPNDSVTVPAPAAPVRVTNPDEEAAAELDLRKRAGSAGATGVLITTEPFDAGGGDMRMRRRVRAIFAPSDSARAQKACGK